jgi:deoxyribonucleoside regulator
MPLNPDERYYIKLKAAHLYYNENLTQQQIANQLHVSRPTLNKLLKEALEEGMVKIEIIDFKNLSQLIELEQNLCKKFDLIEAKVTKTFSQDGEHIRDSIARATASYLELALRSKMRFGIGWGKTIEQTMKYIRPSANIHNLEIITLVGGFGATQYNLHTNSLAQTLARQYKDSTIQYISAPAFIQDEELLQALLKEENIKSVMESMHHMDIALVGVDGPLDSDSTTYLTKSISQEWMDKLNAEHAVGNIVSRFFDENGNICSEEYERRVISIDLNILKNTPLVIAAAGGHNKVKSLQAAAKKKYYNVLITDETTALAMLNN